MDGCMGYMMIQIHILVTTDVVSSYLIIMTLVSVFIGRLLMSIWMGDSRIHELYTAACGLYTCWVTLRAATVIYNWVPQGWAVIFGRVSEWTILVGIMLHCC